MPLRVVLLRSALAATFCSHSNILGDELVKADRRGKPGFLPHLATTGLVTLYEGITVATFDDDGVAKAGCAKLLREHESGRTIVVYRPGRAGGEGALIADGAFTKLMSEGWDDRGSPRFVKNCAALLAVQPSSGPDEFMREFVKQVTDKVNATILHNFM